MASEEVPATTKESLDEKLGDLKLEEPEKCEDTKEEVKDVVPPADEKPTAESVESEPAAEDGATEPATREAPVEATPEDVETKPPSKKSSIKDKISTTLHKMVGKD